MKLLPAAVIFLTPVMAAPAAASPFDDHCRTRAAAAPGYALKGDAPGWLFLRAELEHAATGGFWKPGPHPSIAVMQAFQTQLTNKGVALIVAPVPAKLSLYPDKLLASAGPEAVVSLTPFLAELKKAGLTAVDLETAFRSKLASQPFCASDAHWSPAGIAIAAEAIFAAVKDMAGVKEKIKSGVIHAGAPEKLTIKGDLTEDDATRGTPAETLTITPCGGANGKPVPADPDSPVILLGDSHTMVFSDGKELGMHCSGAGLRDHLQVRFGFPLAQISNQNSGSAGARRVLAQRVLANPDFWRGRKLVIWVFSVREFTAGKWR